MSRRGMLIILSGPSGVGKDSVRLKVLERNRELQPSVSATTREMRPGEKDGIDYFFITQDRFDEMIRENAFLEYVRYNNKSYGTPKHFVCEKLDSGIDVLLKIEVNGALNVKHAFPEAILIFLLPPSMQELWQRLTSRGTGSVEDSKNRFQTAYRELEYYDQYDYLVINDKLEDAIDRVSAIYTTEKMRCIYSADICENLKKETIDYEIPTIK